jgi:serine/threonine protein kinase
MSVAPGARIGIYEITALIGAGGMGEVYRGRDTKLDRDVAIKVLPETFASDPERIARFQREAKTLASLNHPHIGAIYGVEESSGIMALVLAGVERRTLADRIAECRFRVNEGLPIARPSKSGKPRRLEPANTKPKSDGTLKIVDVGFTTGLRSSSRESSQVTPSSEPDIYSWRSLKKT